MNFLHLSGRMATSRFGMIFQYGVAMRRPLLGVTLSVLLLIGGAPAAETPNVVIVMTDDQGHGDLSCHGNLVLRTPHLDALHADSVRFVDYHVAPTCSPTRSAFLTGHWTNRTGVWHTIMGRSMLRADEVTMGQVFQDGGYATGMFGKWHLGDNYPYRPEDRGYTEVVRHGGGGVGQTPDYWDNAYFDDHYWHNGTAKAFRGFCTDVFFEEAKRFIKDQKEAKRPFLAYIATNAPHGPMHAPESFSEPYRDLGVFRANFFGMIANIDANVGQLRAFLVAEGLAEDTIFIFTTDNGTAAGAEIFNSGMRGIKGSEYDGGHRVPFFIHWPAGGLTGGRDVTPITAHIDILPTLLSLCSIPAPRGVVFDGTDLAPLLRKEAEDWPDRILVTDSQRVKDPVKWRKCSVMTSQWRLVNGEELYDIRRDPGQERDIAAMNASVVDRLRQFYEEWWAELEPTFADATPIYIGHERENPACLTSHDWITTESTPWNHAHIRRALNGPENTGFWNILVTEDGNYEIRLRRWPKEADRAIDAPLEPGSDVPGAKAWRTVPGTKINPVKASLEIGDLSRSLDIEPGMKEAVFNLTLPAGRTRMTALFSCGDGTIYGAYYAYVRKL